MEDDVIKRKLLIDGDGVGDDRRINVLLKTFLKWSLVSKDVDVGISSDEEQKINLQRLIGLVNGCRHAMKRSQLASNTTLAEIEYYERLQDEIEGHVTHTQNDIEQLKRRLIQAEQDRKQKIEYNELCDRIELEPDRKSTSNRIDRLNVEVADLDSARKRLLRLAEERKKMFRVVQESVDQLQRTIENPAYTDPVMVDHQSPSDRLSDSNEKAVVKMSISLLDEKDDEDEAEDDEERDDDDDDQLPAGSGPEPMDEEPILSKDTYPNIDN